jgi:hypothetical protein
LTVTNPLRIKKAIELKSCNALLLKVLSEGVLDGDNGVLGSEGLVEVGKLLVGEPLGGVALLLQDLRLPDRR